MKSSYRRALYDSTPYRIETVETGILTTYRGANYAVHRPLKSGTPTIDIDSISALRNPNC